MNREKRVANYLLSGFGLVSFILLSLPMTGKVRALRAYAAYLMTPLPYYGSRGVERLASLPAGVSRIISVDMENRRLTVEIKEAALLHAEVQALRRENERLALALSLSTSAPGALLWARVMERSPQTWNRSVLIDAGEEEGVEVNSPVLGAQGRTLGVVGRVTEVDPRTSKVLLLGDELSAVASYLPSSRWEGLVQGGGGARLAMNYLPVEAVVRVGDAVATSQTSATFPPDLPIGTVTKVFDREPFTAFQSVEVTPTVPPGSLDEVMVLRRRKRGAR